MYVCVFVFVYVSVCMCMCVLCGSLLCGFWMWSVRVCCVCLIVCDVCVVVCGGFGLVFVNMCVCGFEFVCLWFVIVLIMFLL